jgi:prepilin-type N-terminal cleavage/methylation domain-containing protein
VVLKGAIMAKGRKGKGFTYMELLVVVVIIGILAAMVLPIFFDAKKKAKIAQVKSNMHTCQLAADAYAAGHAGNCPQTIASILPYYPGGAAKDSGASGTVPPNPYTGAPDAPTLGTITDVEAARRGGAKIIGEAGKVEYNPIGTSSYAVVGLDDNGRAITSSSGGLYILSNQ